MSSLKVPIRAILVAVVVACGLLDAQGRRPVFTPAVSVEGSYTDNAAIVGTGADSSDYTTAIGATLRLDHERKHGSTNLSYTGGYVKSKNNSALDHDNHRLRLNLIAEPGEGSLTFIVFYRLTQEQGRADSVEGTEFFLVERVDRETLGASINYRRPLRGQWLLGGGLGSTVSKYDTIAGFGDPAATPDDRTSGQASIDLARRLSRRSDLGVEYVYQKFDLDQGLDEEVHNVGVTFRHRLGERKELNLRLGGFDRSPDDGSASTSDERGLRAQLAYTRAFSRFTLSINGGRSASDGGALDGTATNTFVGLAVANTATDSWRSGGAARFARREPSDPAAAELDTLSLRLHTERLLRRARSHSLGLRFSGSWVDQSSDDDPAGSPGARFSTGSFYTASAGIVWYPRGVERTRSR